MTLAPGNVLFWVDVTSSVDDDPNAYASLDLSLAWILQQKKGEAGPPAPPAPGLGKRNLFLLACREALRDGLVDGNDNEILKRMQKLLMVPPAEATKMFGVAKKELLAGKLPPAKGPLTPRKLFLKACRLASHAGRPDARETEILAGLATALEIDAQTRERMLGPGAGAGDGAPGEAEVGQETALFEVPDTTQMAEVAAAGPVREPGPTLPLPRVDEAAEAARAVAAEGGGDPAAAQGSSSSGGLGASALAVPMRDKDTIRQWGSKAKNRGKVVDVPGPPRQKPVTMPKGDDRTKQLLGVLALLVLLLWFFAGGE